MWPFTQAAIEKIEARTPKDRDRVADFLRVVAIGFVVIGHWLATVVFVRDGELIANRILAIVPWTQWWTWVFQVMPVFFMLGGFANARSWNHALERDEGWAAWIQRRASRLLAPLLPLLGASVGLVFAFLAWGWSGREVQLASQAIFIPIWFLGTYIIVIVCVPLTWRLHRAWGALVVIALVATAAVVDSLARLGVPFVQYINSWAVWTGIHQCGYFWYDKRLPDRGALGIGLFAAGTAALVALVTMGGYPPSMVAVGEGVRSNVSPPTVAIFVLLFAQLGLILATRRRLEQWLRRPPVWAVVTSIGSATLTIFLWHMTAMILVAALLHGTGIWELTEIDARWWASRPLWLALCALVLACLIAIFRRFESVGKPCPAISPVRVVIGLGAVLAGIGGILRNGLYDPDEAWIPWAASASLLAGLATLGVLGRRRAGKTHPA